MVTPTTGTITCFITKISPCWAFLCFVTGPILATISLSLYSLALTQELVNMNTCASYTLPQRNSEIVISVGKVLVGLDTNGLRPIATTVSLRPLISTGPNQTPLSTLHHKVIPHGICLPCTCHFRSKQWCIIYKSSVKL